MYTMEYYLARKKNEITSSAGKYMELEIITLSEESHAQKYKYYFPSSVEISFNTEHIRWKQKGDYLGKGMGIV